ncbi:BspA family leucine-rich repeat surface protein [Bifidobacterium sp. ESL0798]|uniref:BspA family leucine-rich repeat surface protein n=1 Tax=Bifidobacterium sp. ESL0798 TaxID=2983235 RepID=UPI0023F62526|nr:BspA family leucine-rich repeat surface protein [Bifidobacterium sp. ESL0798]WEV73795.1 BspA family leucine-rich repeat surface protein [Bifidobacterium sp. ESL0798]
MSSAQGEEPSTTPLTRGGTCSDTGPMTHGHWTLASSAEYGGDCTLTFTADDPHQENDFEGLETMPGTATPFSHIKTLHNFAYAKHIVFNGVNKTQLPENSRFMFGDWDPTLNYTYVKTFKGNGLVDTSHVKTMEGIFQGDRGMTSLDLSGWDTSHVTSMRSMFDGIQLASLDIADFDTHNVTDMNHMFYSACNINTLDLSKWDTTKLDFTIKPNGTSNTDDMFCRVNRLTVGPKTRLSNRSFRGNPVASAIHARPSTPGRSYTDKWIKVSHLSNGATGATEPLTNAQAQSQDDFTSTLATDPNRAGTYVWQTAPLHTLNLESNLASLPSGYTAAATARGYTADSRGNLSAAFTDMTVGDVPMPEFGTAGYVTDAGTPRTVTTLNPDVALPASNPYTLIAPSSTTNTYTLSGWSTTPTGAVDHNLGGTANVAGGDVTLYAVWQVHHAPAPNPSAPSGTSPSSPSAASGSSSTSSASAGTGSTSSATVQPAMQTPTPAGFVAAATTPTLSPAPTVGRSARLLSAPRTGATTTKPAPGNDAGNATAPNTSVPLPQRRICKIAYYSEGSVAPAAVVCKNEDKKTTVSAVPTPVSRTAVAPAWPFMLVLAVLSFFAIFLYRRRNEFIAAHHRSLTVIDR